MPSSPSSVAFDSSSPLPPPVLFDLDGTLIDSAPSILTSLAAAFESCGVRPVEPLSPTLIGPPLRQTLQRLIGEDPRGPSIDALAQAFMAHYDVEGYKATRVIEPIPALLDALAQQGRALYIVTNKRLHPTQLILEHLGWRARFAAVYALDTLLPAAPNKGELLRHVVRNHALDTTACWYVGDRDEDSHAAAHAGLPCLRVPWGYEGISAVALASASDDAALQAFTRRLLRSPRESTDSETQGQS